MTYDIMAQCADMVFADAVIDRARQTGRSEDEVRSEIISSRAYEALYDFDTGLWQEGPDYFVDFFLRMSAVR